METNTNDRARQPLLLVRIETVKPYAKKTLRAFVDFELTEIGLLIRGATFHQKDRARWISLPAREWQKGGERGWAPILECPDKYAKYRLQDSVLAAPDEYMARQADGGR
jgi:hypothetical protein